VGEHGFASIIVSLARLLANPCLPTSNAAPGAGVQSMILQVECGAWWGWWLVVTWQHHATHAAVSNCCSPDPIGTAPVGPPVLLYTACHLDGGATALWSLKHVLPVLQPSLSFGTG